jgi:hypothetical protein
MEPAEGAIRGAALCSEERRARQVISRWETQATGYRTRVEYLL